MSDLLTREQIDEMWDVSMPEGSLTMDQVAEELMTRILQVAKAQSAKTKKGLVEWLDAEINVLKQHIEELERRRKPLIAKMDNKRWTMEEDKFMLSSVEELVHLPKTISKLEELKQALKKEVEDG